MTNALTVNEQSNWAAMQQQASVLVKSGFLPPAVNTAEKALALALTGRELGIGMMEAIRGINIIQGKPSISPQLMLALANRTRELENLKIEETESGVVVTVKRKGRDAYVTYFGEANAKAQNLFGKDNYKKQPMIMYKWRALSEALRFTFPDAISGLYTPDELGVEVIADEQGSMQVKAEPLPNKFEIKKKEVINENPERIGQNSLPASAGTNDVSVSPSQVHDQPEEIEFEAPKENQEVEKIQKVMNGKISDAQRKRVFAIMKSVGLTEEQVKEYILVEFAKESTKGLHWKEMNQLVEWMQSHESPLVGE